MSPQHDEISLLIIRDWDTTAIGKFMGVVLVPVAHLGAISNIRTSKSTHKAFDPVDTIGQRSPTGGRDPKSHCFRATLITNLTSFMGNLIQSLIPRDDLPFGIS